MNRSLARSRSSARTRCSVHAREGLILAVAAGILVIVTTRLPAQEIESIPKVEAPVHGDAKNGKRLYESYGCSECHGGEGQGSPLSGPRIAPEPMHFPTFLRYIRKPTGQMPPYTAKITSDAELTDIYTYLQSIPHPRDAKKIPLLAAPTSSEKKK